ncbi:hypothetical protein BGZ60DRAFT_53851 [Tricladium varicosporioides]|nr:hypothetical protein BGZ60DRAFT_53851 [Hymenoscyphus varicosporioides]
MLLGHFTSSSCLICDLCLSCLLLRAWPTILCGSSQIPSIYQTQTPHRTTVKRSLQLRSTSWTPAHARHGAGQMMRSKAFNQKLLDLNPIL